MKNDERRGEGWLSVQRATMAQMTEILVQARTSYQERAELLDDNPGVVVRRLRLGECRGLRW